MYCLCMILGGPKNNTLSPEASGTLRSVESSPSAMFRMPSRAPEQKDWTPDESSASCEECQTLFSLVRRQFIVSLVLAEPVFLLLLPATCWMFLLSSQKSAFCPLAEKLWIGSKMVDTFYDGHYELSFVPHCSAFVTKAIDQIWWKSVNTLLAL